MKFVDLKIITPIQKAVDVAGYLTPTPIQEKAIPIVLEGRDLFGCAQTGTGKTAAFGIPILQMLYLDGMSRKEHRKIRALILTPTRELAIQIKESFTLLGKFTGLKSAVIYGGVPQSSQTAALRLGVDIVVATPGRLLDLIEQGYVVLDSVKTLVLDEADRMLDMGFSPDVKRILALLPITRQTLMFSATIPPEIIKLTKSILRSPVQVEVTPNSSTVETINQSVYYVKREEKKNLLVRLLDNRKLDSVLIFTRTKHGADKVAKHLMNEKISAQAIHGDKSQNSRQQALNNFKAKRTRVLVATDIAARGIDVQELSHVINFDIPNVPETYVHRIGRTGRAGMGGTALSFCDVDEKGFLRDIQKLISKNIPVISQ